jgi:alkylated DNA nucleotide flippase Atl1/3-methyladenine DNA glycosylase AlkD
MPARSPRPKSSSGPHPGARPGPHPSYQRIYAVVAAIPEGRVATYGQVAALAGLPGHARQVGYALHALPAGAELPWQRVINARGEVSPRAEQGIEGYQRFLLEEEGVELDAAGKVDLGRCRWEPDDLPQTRPARPRRPPAGTPATPATPENDALDDLETVVASIEAALRPLGTRRRAAGAKAYLKSEHAFLGVDTPTLRRQARAWLRSQPRLPARQLLALAKALWQRPVHELRSFAIEILGLGGAARLAGGREARQALDLCEWMLRRAGSWAYVDAIAIQLAGPLVEDHPELAARLDRWSADPDFWLRRSSLLALLLPLRRGGGDWDRFVRYADGMIEEREFFIRKAIGWVLREVGKRRPKLVRAFLTPRLDRISGLTRREAVKYLPGRSLSAPVVK